MGEEILHKEWKWGVLCALKQCKVAGQRGIDLGEERWAELRTRGERNPQILQQREPALGLRGEMPRRTRLILSGNWDTGGVSVGVAVHSAWCGTYLYLAFMSTGSLHIQPSASSFSACSVPDTAEPERDCVPVPVPAFEGLTTSWERYLLLFHLPAVPGSVFWANCNRC